MENCTRAAGWGAFRAHRIKMPNLGLKPWAEILSPFQGRNPGASLKLAYGASDWASPRAKP